MTHDFQLADLAVHADLGALALTDYATSSLDTLTWFDGDGTGSAEGVTPAVLGRTAFMDARLTRTEARALLQASATAPWDGVPVAATLTEADPAVRDGLYDAAERLHRHFLDAEGRVGATTISTVLHVTRPGLFPILDGTIRQLYAHGAEAAWQAETRSERPYSGKSYWPVIRADVTAAAAVIQGWRDQLAADEAGRRLAALSDVRLWDIVTRQIATAGQRVG